MERVQQLLHRGKKIILLDLSQCQPEETVQVIPQATRIIGGCVSKSALVLTDVTGAHYNKDVADAIKAMVQANTPYIRASAIVGVAGVQSVLLQTVIFLTRREIKTFDTRENAMNWLTEIN